MDIALVSLTYFFLLDLQDCFYNGSAVGGEKCDHPNIQRGYTMQKNKHNIIIKTKFMMLSL